MGKKWRLKPAREATWHSPAGEHEKAELTALSPRMATHSENIQRYSAEDEEPKSPGLYGRGSSSIRPLRIAKIAA